MATKGMNNDVFISYRRKRGEAWASLIKELLEKNKVRVYLDKHKKRTKDFKEALLRNIDQSNNFVLILSEGVFEKRDDDIDWVREEIKYAKINNKNIIAVSFNGYDPSAVKWDEEDENIKFLKTYENIPFVDTNAELLKASIKSILDYLVDENDKPWHERSIDNNSWYDSGITEEDRLWMIANNEVCKKMDLSALKKMLSDPVFLNRKEVNYFNLLCYDIDTLIKRINSTKNPGITVNVYGFCHDFDLDKANEAFGENHFMAFRNENDIYQYIEKLQKINKIPSFDIVEMTLILKDCVDPEKIMREITKYLNSQGSACYIRDLDDDLVVAYPDDKDLIGTLIKYLSLDPGAGNRHFGKKIYNFLKKSGADKIYMMDSLVTTANFNTKNQRRLCDAYFSYLIPEFKVLVKDNPENEEYKDALDWLDIHYEKDVISLFSSNEFYFSSGYISGFAIYTDDNYYEDDL